VYEYVTLIKMHDVDAAGVLFFANQFKLMHDAYEAFMDSGNMGLAKIINEAQFHIPIVHTEADFHAPLRLGDRVSIKLTVKRKGTSSFTLAYKIYNNDIFAGSGETVHVTIHPKTHRKIALPLELIKLLK
jgi:1,4-dihydroxy-2-naphthoyl-CoA hydrolase